jgi:hypothetical protein
VTCDIKQEIQALIDSQLRVYGVDVPSQYDSMIRGLRLQEIGKSTDTHILQSIHPDYQMHVGPVNNQDLLTEAPFKIIGSATNFLKARSSLQVCCG